MEIKPYEKNAKKHPPKQLKQLAAIVQEVGWRQPVLVNQEGIIVAGHGRWATYETYKKEYELKEIWVMDDKGNTIMGAPEKTPLTTEQEKAYRLADNKLNESAWDNKLAMPELESLSPKFQKLTGFDISILEVKEDDFDLANQLKNAIKTKSGDIYELGAHKLICGDSTKAEAFEKLLNGELANLVFTDPPYNVNYNSEANNAGRGKIMNDKKSDEDFVKFITEIAVNTFLFSTEDAVLYMWYASKNQAQFQAGLVGGGYRYSQSIIWVKEHMVLSMGVLFHRLFEPCMIGIKNGKFRKNKDFSNMKDVWEIGRDEFQDMVDVWYIHCDKTNEYVHPTQKPIKLAERGLRRSSFEGDIVLDCFGGSGSTLMACEQMRRNARLIELDPKFCDAIVTRYCMFKNDYNIILNGEPIVWVAK